MARRSSASKSPRSSRRATDDRFGYIELSKKPLQILAFLFPLIIAYEFSLVVLLRSGDRVLTNNAHKTLLEFFRAFGVEPESGYFLGGIVVIVVLVLWHVLARDRWIIDLRTVGFMWLEAFALSLPLLVLGQLIQKAVASGIVTPDPSVASLDQLSLWSKVAISFGAGLYEELMFRMLLIAVLHTLLVDVGKASHAVGAAVAVAVSAAAFTWYHPLGQSLQRVVFFFLAGLYFGGIYVGRGFGIVVGTHALYDIITFSLGAAHTSN